MKLYEIPRNSKLLITLAEGLQKFCTFHHIDGAYSYITLDEDPTKVLHLKAWTPLLKVDYYYVIDTEQVEKEKIGLTPPGAIAL